MELKLRYREWYTSSTDLAEEIRDGVLESCSASVEKRVERTSQLSLRQALRSIDGHAIGDGHRTRAHQHRRVENHAAAASPRADASTQRQIAIEEGHGQRVEHHQRECDMKVVESSIQRGWRASKHADLIVELVAVLDNGDLKATSWR